MSQFFNSVRAGNLGLIAGPCLHEGYDHAMRHAEALLKVCAKYKVPLLYKSSFEKANRSSENSPSSVLKKVEALSQIANLGDKLGIEITTDVHTVDDVVTCADYGINVLQVPALLCRQTALLHACSSTHLPVNVKKGQFMQPSDILHVVEKLWAHGTRDVILTDRGASFGYGSLVSDSLAVPTMAAHTFSVADLIKKPRPLMCIDATHSVQYRSGAIETDGNRLKAPYIARAGVAVGADIVFMEVHEDPYRAPSDGAVMQRLDSVETTLKHLVVLYEATTWANIRSNPWNT